MRRDGTRAEALLWNELKSKKLDGFKFVRQWPIGPYFADFCCRERKLVVELDGSGHALSEHDRKRDAFLNKENYDVLRFWNDDVVTRRTAVCDTILAALNRQFEERVAAFDLRFAPAARAKPESFSGNTEASS